MCPTLSIVKRHGGDKARDPGIAFYALAMRRASAMVCTRSAHTYAPVLRHQACNLAPRLASACQGRAVPLRRLSLERRAFTTFRLNLIIHGGRIAIKPPPPLHCPSRMDKPVQIGNPIQID